MKIILGFVFTLAVFSANAQYTRLHNFAVSPDGYTPQYGTLLSDGTFLYGMTQNGGLNGVGIIFKVKLDGTGYVKLFDFSATTGHSPQSGLVTDGTFLYGMTQAGGANDFGTIFKIKPDGTGFIKMLDFNGAGNGRSPYGALVYDGTYLYGMTFVGGVNGATGSGVIFKILPDGSGYVKLHDFAPGTNGRLPYGTLLLDGTSMYGMTKNGGSIDAGVVFKIQTNGTGYTKILDFNGPNGAAPYGALISDGTFLYGVTSSGGPDNSGNIFKVKPDGSGYSNLHDFTFSATDGFSPLGSLTFEGGFLYGMTPVGGTNGAGSIFKILPDGSSFTEMLDFDGPVTGGIPNSSFISDGTYLYATTKEGGTNNLGTIFKYALAPSGPPAITSFTPTSGAVGTTVTITGTNFSSTPANNIVYFGATRAVVTASTTTQLTVTVPSGATFEPITVTVAGLIAYSGKSFTPTFTGGTFDACAYAPKVDFTTSSAPSEISIADLDGDGKNDLALENGSNVSVLRNTSSGPGNVSYATKIDFITGSSPTSIFTGDLDGDGKLDMVTCNQLSNTLSVYRNTSTSGSITYAPKVDFVTGTRPYSVTIRDLDKDGKADLAVANYASTTISVFRNTSSGAGNINFATKVDFTAAAGPYSIASEDFDADGKDDLAVANWNANTVSVFRNTSTAPGNISFATKVDFVSGTTPFSISIGDFDGDAKSDIAVANINSNTISVFRNTSSGSGNVNFNAKVDLTTGTEPVTVSTGDLDGDGKIDIAVTNNGSNTVSLFRNTSAGSGSISYATKIDLTTGSNPYAVSMGDLDGDGRTDLVVTNFGSNTLSVFRNTIPVTPGITSFSPNTGNVGNTIIITGTNFSTSPANNIVKFFNDKTATVTSSTATSITTTVPAGTTTGKISVAVGCNTVVSAADFTVTGGSAIDITTQPQNFPACPGDIASFTTAATGTTNIAYHWQIEFDGFFTDINNGNGYAGVNTSTFTINTNQNNGVGIFRCRITGDGAPEVTTDEVSITLKFDCEIVNKPPVIEPTTTALQAGGIVTIDLTSLISDPDDNLDLSTLHLVNGTSERGAQASLDGLELILDYNGVVFLGTDHVSLEVCDLEEECVEQQLTIEVGGDVIIFNAVSPNGDSKNEVFLIQYIEMLPDAVKNHVTILNRWGDVVFEINNYNNTDRVFKGVGKNGNDLPSGTYYYKIEFPGGRKSKTGYLSLKH